MSVVLITNSRTGQSIAPRVRLADTAVLRLVGLLGKKGLPVGEGLLIRPSSSIHTYFMRFALDLIFMKRNNEVSKVVRNIRPYRFSASWGAHQVLEMAAGALDGVDVQPGDRLEFTAVEVTATT